MGTNSWDLPVGKVIANQIQRPVHPRTQRPVTAEGGAGGQDLRVGLMGALAGGADLDSQPEGRPGAGKERVTGSWKKAG